MRMCAIICAIISLIFTIYLGVVTHIECINYYHN